MRRAPQSYRNGEMVIVIDCSDLERSSQFWADVLGYSAAASASGRYRSLVPHSGDGIEVLLQQVHDDKHEKNRLHLDLRTRDLAAEVRRILDLGASLRTDKPVIEDGGAGISSPTRMVTSSACLRRPAGANDSPAGAGGPRQAALSRPVPGRFGE